MTVNSGTATTQVSPKVLGGAFGSAVATVFWVIAATTFWEGTFSDVELSALVGSTSIIVAALVGYFVPDGLRQDVAPSVPLEPAPKPVDPYDPYSR